MLYTKSYTYKINEHLSNRNSQITEARIEIYPFVNITVSALLIGHKNRLLSFVKGKYPLKWNLDLTKSLGTGQIRS